MSTRDVKDAMQTSVRIIEAAEALFARQGFAETSMRQITTEAEVNLAAVNYHYGSKQGLIKAVATRVLEPLCGQLEGLLTERRLTSALRIRVEELLEMLMRALLRVSEERPHALNLFMRLLEQPRVPAQERLRSFLLEEYGERMKPFVELLRQDSTPMQGEEFFWRLHCLLGALVFALSSHATPGALSEGSAVEVERILHRLVPVLSAGFQARAEHNQFCAL